MARPSTDQTPHSLPASSSTFHTPRAGAAVGLERGGVESGSREPASSGLIWRPAAAYLQRPAPSSTTSLVSPTAGRDGISFRSLGGANRPPAHLPSFIPLDGRPQFVPFRPPNRSAPEARAIEQAADFTFSFVPDPTAWTFLNNVHDGRVLLGQRISTNFEFWDFLVCDPLHRRYVKIPRIPDDLMASAADNGIARHLAPVLAPAGENDEEESFRIICTVQLKHKVMGFVYSSCNQTWRGIISTICLPNGIAEYVPDYAHGCMYFYDNGYSLVLDTSVMEFSIIELPPHDFHSSRVIVEAEEGRLWLITIANGTSDLRCKNWQSNGVGAQELQHDKLIPLPDCEINYDWRIEGIAGRYLVLSAYNEIYDESSPSSEHFVLDIKTLLVEKLCSSNNDLFDGGFPYARFPPPLALPSI